MTWLFYFITICLFGCRLSESYNNFLADDDFGSGIRAARLLHHKINRPSLSVKVRNDVEAQRWLKTDVLETGYLVGNKFTSSACLPGDIEYSAIYRIGACVTSSSFSYSYTNYAETPAGFEVVYTSYSDKFCQSYSYSETIIFSGGCSDSTIYTYASSMSHLPSGIMFA